MSRTGIARTRHIRHRSLERMRYQDTIPNFYAAEAVDLAGTGVTDDFVWDEVTPVDFVKDSATPVDFTAANATEIMTASTHGLVSGQGPFHVITDTTLPDGLTVDTDYWVEVIDADDFYWTLGPNDPTPVAVDDDGTGTHSFFLVDGLVAVAHALLTGQGPLVLTNSGGALPAGLSGAVDYWVNVVDADNFYLTLGPNDRTPVVMTDDGTGTHSFAIVNAVVAVAHGLVQGQGPFVLTTGTTLPAGLSLTAQYWASVLSVDKFHFTTAPKSLSSVPITDAGTGTHSFALAAEVAADIIEINKRGVQPVTIANATDVDDL